MLDLPVEFGGVSIGELAARLGVTFSRSDLSLEEADESLCGKRITGTVQVTPKGQAEGQQQFDGMDDAHAISAAFDVKSIRATCESIACGLTFNLNSIEVSELAKFAKRKGRVIVESVEVLSDGGEGEDDDHEERDEAPARRKPSRRQKSMLTNDAGAAMPITALIEFGITKKKCDIIRGAAGGDTIGHMEAMMRSNEWWHRDLKGMGEEWITKLQDAHLKFRQRHPMPTEEDLERLKASKDLADARLAGKTAAERGYARDSCSYDAGTPEAAAWLASYDATAKPAGTIWDAAGIKEGSKA